MENSEINELNEKLVKARKIYTENQTEIKNLNIKIEELTKFNDTLQHTIDQLNYTCDMYEKQVAELEKEIERLNTEYIDNSTVTVETTPDFEATTFAENVTDYTESPVTHAWSSTHGTYPKDSVFQI